MLNLKEHQRYSKTTKDSMLMKEASKKTEHSTAPNISKYSRVGLNYSIRSSVVFHLESEFSILVYHY